MIPSDSSSDGGFNDPTSEDYVPFTDLYAIRSLVKPSNVTLDLTNYHPDPCKLSRTCQFCFKTRKPGRRLRVCAQCHHASYCGKECQAKDWPLHRAECQHTVFIQKRLERLRKAKAQLPWFNYRRDPASLDALAVPKSIDAWYRHHYTPLLHLTASLLELQHYPLACLSAVAAVVLKRVYSFFPHQFSAEGFGTVPLEYVRGRFDSLGQSTAMAPIESMLGRSRRAIANGLPGFAVVLLICDPFCIAVPVGLTGGSSYAERIPYDPKAGCRFKSRVHNLPPCSDLGCC